MPHHANNQVGWLQVSGLRFQPQSCVLQRVEEAPLLWAMAARCPVCWPEGILPPYEHNLPQGQIPHTRSELESGILGSGIGMFSANSLKRMVVKELRHAWQKNFNLIPHPNNPCRLLAYSRVSEFIMT